MTESTKFEIPHIATRGFVLWYRTMSGVVTEVFTHRDGEWYQAPISNVIDCVTQYRIGRWLGPSRWSVKDVLEYLGLSAEEAHFEPFMN